MSAVTLIEFEALIAAAYTVKEEIERVEREVLEPLQKSFAAGKAKILDIMNELEKGSYKSKVCQVVKSTHYTYLVPKTKEDKDALFQWLKDQGENVFYDKVGVHSQALLGLCNEQKEIAKEEGRLDYLPPGVKEGETQIRLTFKKV